MAKVPGHSGGMAKLSPSPHSRLSRRAALIGAAGLITTPAFAQGSQNPVQGGVNDAPNNGHPPLDAQFFEDGVRLMEDQQTILFYRTKPEGRQGVMNRINYIGSLYAPDGTALIEDGGEPDQRGLYWGWREVLIDGDVVADSRGLKGINFFTRRTHFESLTPTSAALTVDVDWIITAGPELRFAANETTTTTIFRTLYGERRVRVETIIQSKLPGLALDGAGRDEAGIGLTLKRPRSLTFSSGGGSQDLANQGTVAAGDTMTFAWQGDGAPAWTVEMACAVNGEPTHSWRVGDDVAAQSAVLPAPRPYIIPLSRPLELRTDLSIRPTQ
ncbi:MAG: hypothetical protein U1E50_00140 [Caulobacteraceae bacterium]